MRRCSILDAKYTSILETLLLIVKVNLPLAGAKKKAESAGAASRETDPSREDRRAEKEVEISTRCSTMVNGKIPPSRLSPSVFIAPPSFPPLRNKNFVAILPLRNIMSHTKKWNIPLTSVKKDDFPELFHNSFLDFQEPF